MSNLGEWIEEKAIEKTIEKTTKELILNMHKYGLSLEAPDLTLPYLELTVSPLIFATSSSGNAI